MSPLCRVPAHVLASEQVVPVVLEFVQPPVAVYQRMNPTADAGAYAATLTAAHREFVEKVASLGVKVQVGSSSVVVAGPDGDTVMSVPQDFTHVFNGIGVLIPGQSVAQIQGMGGLRAISLNEERVYLNVNKSIPFTGAPQVWERLDASGRRERGEGVVVAIIDTGIDWTHPAFGGFAKAPNEKVVYAVSYTGEPPIDNFGHGTHVAGIIAGDGDYKGTPRGDSQMTGMAPKAKLMGYKVLSASGSGSATNIVMAMEDAVKRGAQVMNLSLGDSVGDPNSPECSSANNAMLAGVIVCIAAGNSGPDASTVGAPGAAHHVITVGASTDDGVTALMAQLVDAAGTTRNLEMRLLENSPALPNPSLELAYVACGLGAGAGDFPSQVSGKIALVQRGNIAFRDKALNAQKAGAVACVIYNNNDGNFFGSLGTDQAMPTIAVVSISKADGELLVAGIDNGVSRAKLRLNAQAVPQPSHLAEFSSRGPNKDGWIKPELTAPGVNVWSTTILQAGVPGGGMPDASGYISASGTSMATPHVAGASALLRQAHPNWTSMQVKAALANTAQWMDGQGTVMDQGNGAMALLKAIDARAILVTAADPFGPTFSFGTVVNAGKVHQSTQALTIIPLVNPPDPGEFRLSVELAGHPDGLKGELIPSGNSFELTLTADGTVLKDGAYYGWAIAEAGWGALRLPFYYEAARQPQAVPPEAPELMREPIHKQPGRLPHA
jgi:minor extracellular serine protease Vpr